MKTTSADIARARASYFAGETLPQIAALIGCHHYTVRRWAQRYGWVRSFRRGYPPSVVAEAARLYRDPYISVAGVAARVGVGEWIIYHWAKRYGWPAVSRRRERA